MGVSLTRVTEKLDALSRISAVATAFFLPISTTFTDIFFISAAGFCVLSGNWQEKWRIIKESRIAFYFIALFVLFAIGLTYTSAPLPQALKIFSKYDKLPLAVLLMPVFAQEKWRQYVKYAFLVAMILTLLSSYIKFFGWFNFYSKFIDISVFKDRIEQNFLMAFTCYLLALEFFEKPHNLSIAIYRCLITLLLALAIYNTLFLSEGRSGYLVFMVLLLLFVWQIFKWKGLMLGLIGLIILIATAFLFSDTFKTRIERINPELQQYIHGQKETSIGQRMDYDRTSLDIMKQRPIFGTGTGSFQHEFESRNPHTKSASNPHNEYLNIGVQLGIIGILLLLMIFYVSWRNSKYLPIPYRYMAQALTAAMAAGITINSWLMDTTEGHFYVFFMVLCFAALANQRSANTSTLNNDNKSLRHSTRRG